MEEQETEMWFWC